MMPLFNVQFAPSSVTVTGELTAGLATTGSASATRSIGAVKVRAKKTGANRPRSLEEKDVFIYSISMIFLFG
jgi:hypothetical protein